jgi:rhamnosyltransferase
MPRVAILLATHDGARYLEEQLDSILGQEGVDVTVFASDDGSRDETPRLLAAAAERDRRIRILPATRCGSSWANFYRLLLDVDASGFDAVGFADQDDRWVAGRLALQMGQLQRFDAVSSDVTAFDERGRRRRIRKSQPQRRLDHAFESAGPGSTFLLTPTAATLVRETLRTVPRARTVEAHDWLTYALVRAAGLRWHIDPAPLVEYRQHGANVLGANVGVRARVDRTRRIVTRWYRDQVECVVEVALEVADGEQRADLERLRALLAGGRAGRLRLAARARSLRRRSADAAALAALIAVGAF